MILHSFFLLFLKSWLEIDCCFESDIHVNKETNIVKIINFMQLCEQTFKPTQLQKQIVIVRNHFAPKKNWGNSFQGKKINL